MRTEFRIFRSAGLVSLGTLTSRLLGLVREILMAGTFGTSQVGSAFFIAFTLPNLLRRLFGEGALSAAFIPAYIKTREENGLNAAWSLTRNLCSFLVLVLGLLSILGMGTAGLMLQMGHVGEKTFLVLLAGRIMLPYMIGICLAAVMMGVLNSHRKFALPAFAPALLNVIWILALLGVQMKPDWSLEEKMVAVCWAILFAGAGQFLIQVPAVRTLGMKRERPVTPLGPGVKQVLLRMGPAALGAAVTQVNVVIDRLLAFWVADYGPAALSYSERLIYLPLGLFATALGSILLPEFSGLVQGGRKQEMTDTLDRSIRGLMWVMIPAAVGLGILTVPIVHTVFERGEFGSDSTLMTSRALMCYAPGLVVFSATKVLIPLFYAHGDTRTPVKIGMIAVSANLGLNLLFIFLLPDGWKHAGLALGTIASSCLQVGILLFLVQKRYVPLQGKRILKSVLRHALACVPMAYAARALITLEVFPMPITLGAAVGTAVVLYAAATWILRCPELREFRRH